MTTARFEPARRLRGAITPPADASISHRAAILGAMASEPVRARNFLHAAGTAATLHAMRTLGALVTVDAGEVMIRGTGLRETLDVDRPIDVGRAGTLLRLLPGWLAGQDGRSYTLDGDAAIRRGPVAHIAEPLIRMGARVEAAEGGLPPLTVHGARLHAIECALPVASAPVKGTILLAALMADGTTAVAEPFPSRDHTERLLAAAGVTVRRDGDRILVTNVDELVLDDVVVPGDQSSAAFLVAAAVLVPGSRIEVRGVGTNWTRTGFLRILARMGGIVVGDLEPPPAEGAAAAGVVAREPAGDLDVAHGPLVGTEVAPEEVPLVADELPLVALLGCFAEGETVVRGAQELRVAGSDRLVAVVEALRGLGGDLEATRDGFVVRGTGGLRGGRLDARGDHRLAMLGAVAGLASREGVRVAGMEAAEAAYPRFTADLAALRRSRG